MTNNYKTLDGRVVAGAMYEDISRRATELV
ncbi:hypothetical protein MNBD_ALPHA03-70, partial [hydrothermal vent metagenome]